MKIHSISQYLSVLLTIIFLGFTFHCSNSPQPEGDGFRFIALSSPKFDAIKKDLKLSMKGKITFKDGSLVSYPLLTPSGMNTSLQTRTSSQEKVYCTDYELSKNNLYCLMIVKTKNLSDPTAGCYSLYYSDNNNNRSDFIGRFQQVKANSNIQFMHRKNITNFKTFMVYSCNGGKETLLSEQKILDTSSAIIGDKEGNYTLELPLGQKSFVEVKTATANLGIMEIDLTNTQTEGEIQKLVEVPTSLFIKLPENLQNTASISASYSIVTDKDTSSTATETTTSTTLLTLSTSSTFVEVAQINNLSAVKNGYITSIEVASTNQSTTTNTNAVTNTTTNSQPTTTNTPSVPATKAVSGGFTDIDGDIGQIGGTVSIVAASDESNLDSYVLYYGSSNTAKTTEIATIAKTGTNLFYVIPLDTSTSVGSYINVFTKNSVGEMADGISIPLSDRTDSNPPTTGILTGSSYTTSSISVNWTSATDDFSSSANMQYLAYYSTTNNLNTVANVESNGTAIGSYASNINTVIATGLIQGTTYSFNVIAKDEYGNKSVYAMQSFSTLDASSPVPGNSGTIASASITGNSLTLNWTYGIDNSTPQASLQYKVVRSTSNNISTTTNAATNGTLIQDWTTNINTSNVTGLLDGTTYYFNVLIRDASGNESIYTTVSATTLDITAPVVGTLSAPASVSYTSLTLNWTAATDNVTAQASLQYKVVQSSSNNISIVADAETIGTLVQDWTANIITKAVTGLTMNTTYYFAVLVKDSAGNKSIYNVVSVTTLNDTTPPTVSSTTPADGTSLTTTASFANNITLVFSEAVNTSTLSMQAANGACSGSIQLSKDNFSTCLAGVLTTTGNPSIVINPNANLTDNLNYKIRVTTAVQDPIGNAMSTYTMATGILTRKPPTVVSETFTICSSFPCDFTITFSEPMDTTTGGAGASFSLPSGNSSCYAYRTIKVATVGDVCFSVTRNASLDSGNTYGFTVTDNTTTGVGNILYLTVKGADDPTYYVTDAVGTPKATTQQWSVGF